MIFLTNSLLKSLKVACTGVNNVPRHDPMKICKGGTTFHSLSLTHGKGRTLQKREEKNAQSERSRAQTHGSESGNALIALGLSHFPLSCIRVSEAPIGASSRISEGPPELLSSVGRFSSCVCCFRRCFVSKHARESVRKRSPGITPRPGIAHTHI